MSEHMIDTYLWSQEPMISSPPIEVVEHLLNINGEEVFEAAILKLENEKYLFISFWSDLITDSNVGITDIEEFDKLNEALMIWNEMVK